MRMEIEANMKQDKPTYILGFDVKGGYNNVNLELLEKKFEEVIVPKLREDHDEEYVITTRMIYHHIVDNPTMKIWEEMEEFPMQKGIQ